MRRVAALLALACGLVSLPAAPQTCPPSDPLCTTNRSPSKPKVALPDTPEPAPAASPAAPAPAEKKPEEKEKEGKKAERQEDDQGGKGKLKKEDKDSQPPARGVITLAEVTITGRVQKPIAAVDVGRISPKIALAELRQPFLERIEKAIYSEPF
jgi:hypothetical protein